MIWILLTEFLWGSLTCSSALCISYKLVGGLDLGTHSLLLTTMKQQKHELSKYILNIYCVPEWNAIKLQSNF